MRLSRKRKLGSFPCGPAHCNSKRVEVDSMTTEPFLLDPASEEFLASNRQRIPFRFRVDKDKSLLVLAGIACLFFLATTILHLFTLYSHPNLQATLQNLMTSLAILTSLCYVIVWKLKANATKANLVRNGQLLTGNILKCSARTAGNGEEYWQSVRVDYQFVTPQQKTITAHWERDRDDLDGSALPEAGRSVLVLYLNDTSFALL